MADGIIRNLARQVLQIARESARHQITVRALAATDRALAAAARAPIARIAENNGRELIEFAKVTEEPLESVLAALDAEILRTAAPDIPTNKAADFIVRWRREAPLFVRRLVGTGHDLGRAEGAALLSLQLKPQGVEGVFEPLAVSVDHARLVPVDLAFAAENVRQLETGKATRTLRTAFLKELDQRYRNISGDLDQATSAAKEAEAKINAEFPEGIVSALENRAVFRENEEARFLVARELERRLKPRFEKLRTLQAIAEARAQLARFFRPTSGPTVTLP